MRVKAIKKARRIGRIGSDGSDRTDVGSDPMVGRFCAKYGSVAKLFLTKLASLSQSDNIVFIHKAISYASMEVVLL